MSTQAQTLTVGEEGDRRAAQLAAGGATLGQIAAKFNPPLSIEQASAAIARGRQQQADRSPKPVPEGPSRAATLAARTRAQLAELATLKENELAAVQARAQLAAAEKALVEAKARVRELQGRTASSVRDTQPLGSASKVIREWAQSNGYDVPPRGRVPKHIRSAYARANPGSAAD